MTNRTAKWLYLCSIALAIGCGGGSRDEWLVVDAARDAESDDSNDGSFGDSSGGGSVGSDPGDDSSGGGSSGGSSGGGSSGGGSDGGSSSGGGTDQCPGISYSNPNVCTECIEGSCCDVVTQCRNDSACAACVDGMGSNCDTNWLYQSRINCVAERCDESCNSQPDACTEIRFTGYNECTGCLESRCCGSMTQCLTGSTCSACWNEEATSNCDNSVEYVRANTCAAELCGDVCSGFTDYCPEISFDVIDNCTVCQQALCCAEIASCLADDACDACYRSNASVDDPGCDSALYSQLVACEGGCSDFCAP